MAGQDLDAKGRRPPGEIGRRNLPRLGIALPCPKNLSHQHLVGILQARGQFVKQPAGSRRLMRLEYTPYPRVGEHLANGRQGGCYFGGVMGVIVEQRRPPPRSQQFQPPVQARKTAQPRRDLIPRHAVFIGQRGGGQGIQHIVFPGHRQPHLAQRSAKTSNLEHNMWHSRPRL